MAQYVGAMAAADTPDTSSGAFLSAVLSVRRGDYGVAKVLVALHLLQFSARPHWAGSPDGYHPYTAKPGLSQNPKIIKIDGPLIHNAIH